MVARLRDLLQESKALNFAVQDFLRAWSGCSTRRNRPVLLDQARLAWFAELNRGLRDPLDDAAFEVRMHETCAQLRQLAHEIVLVGGREHAGLDTGPLQALLGGRCDAQTGTLLFDFAA